MKTHIIALGAVALLLLGACSGKGKDKDAAAQQTPTVNVAKPQVDSITLQKEYPGYLSANMQVDVVGRVNGTLESVNFKGGQYVTKGQVLFHIEDTQYRDAVTKARAALANATAEREYCAKRLAAMEKAFKSNAVSAMDVSQAKNNLAAAEASISSSRAALSDAQTQLGYCTVRATGSGLVTKAFLDPGNYVAGGGAPVKLCTIYDVSTVLAKFSIADDQYQQLLGKEGGTTAPMYRNVPLQFQSELPHQYTADLYYTAPNVDMSTGTILMQGSVKNIDNELKDGMYVSVLLPYGTDPKAVLVKDASISTDQRGQYLYVVGKDGKVQYRPIETGQLYQDTLRVVTKGLQPGEEYVTEALLTVRPGMTVKPHLVK